MSDQDKERQAPSDLGTTDHDSAAAEDKELTEEQKERRRQENNDAVVHGGVTQMGDFDPQLQQKERDEREEENANKGYLNEFDSALPTVDEDNLGDDGDEDRPSDDIAERQGEVPGDADRDSDK